jgi:hypothetical protein
MAAFVWGTVGVKLDELTLADHAEAWARERGETVPPRDTPEWNALYSRWHAWAFNWFVG